MKRLYRSEQNRQLAGVCAGLGKYFEVDPVIFRVLFVFLTFFHGGGLLIYILLAIVMPMEPKPAPAETDNNHAISAAKENDQPQQPAVQRAQASSFFGILIGVILILVGIYFLLEQFNFYHPFLSYFRRYFWENIIAFSFILSGIYFIFLRR